MEPKKPLKILTCCSTRASGSFDGSASTFRASLPANDDGSCRLEGSPCSTEATSVELELEGSGFFEASAADKRTVAVSCLLHKITFLKAIGMESAS